MSGKKSSKRLLVELSLENWEKPTIAPKWKVKDVAVHLLDGNFGYAAGNGIKKPRN